MGDLAPGLRAEIILRDAGIGALAFFADRLQQLPVGGEFVELLVMLVAEPDDIAAVFPDDADRMRKAEQPLAPGADKLAVAIEDHDGVRIISIEAVDPVLGIDRNRARFHLQPLGWALPILV